MHRYMSVEWPTIHSSYTKYSLQLPTVIECKNSTDALYFHTVYIVIFGTGRDYLLSDKCNTNTTSNSNPGSYKLPGNDMMMGEDQFKVADFEVFQIVC